MFQSVEDFGPVDLVVDFGADLKYTNNQSEKAKSVDPHYRAVPGKKRVIYMIQAQMSFIISIMTDDSLK